MSRLAFFVLGLFAATLHAAAPLDSVEFTGVLQAGDTVKLSLTEKESGTARWLRIGDTFSGYTVAAYEREKETVVLTKAGVTTRLRLKESQVKHGELAAPLTNATAFSIYKNLAQLAAASDQFFLEHGATTAKLDDLVGEKKYVRQVTPVAGEDYSTVQFQQGVPVEIMTPSGDSVVFDTRSNGNRSTFYTTKAGDTGMKIAARCGVALSDLAALNREVNFSRMTVGQPLRVR